MKDHKKYITSIVALVTGMYFVGSWVETIFGTGVASFLTSVGVVSFIGYALFYLWDKFLWKQSFLSKIVSSLTGLYELPVLEGKWKIEYVSTYDGGTKGAGEAQIQQTYSNFYIEGVFGESSRFYSFSTQLKQDDRGKWFIVYAYRNKSKDEKLIKSSLGGLHEGFAYLEVKSRNKLEGHYANDENRRTQGKLTLKKL